MDSNMLKLNINEKLLNDIQEGLSAGKNKIKLKNKFYSDDVMLTYKLCLSKNPEIINVDYGRIGILPGMGIDYLSVNQKVAWNTLKGKVSDFTMDDSRTLSEYAERIAKELRLSTKSNMKKVVSIYDYLSKNVIYIDTENAHDAWGALIDKKAVCEGISYAFCLLAKKCGLAAVVVSGKLKGQPHAWNIVSVEGIPYHVDVTANLEAKENGISNYDYIFLRDSDLKEREWDKSVYPKCNSNQHNYFMIARSFATNENEAINIILRQIYNHKVIYFRCSENMILNENLAQRLFIKSCEKANKHFSSLSIIINPKINTAQIIYK